MSGTLCGRKGGTQWGKAVTAKLLRGVVRARGGRNSVWREEGTLP